MTARQRGFTLTEMMAVIVIIGVLAMMAIPTFQERIVREQIIAAIPLADIAKTPLAAAWTTAHEFPPDNTTTGLPSPDKIVNNYISALEVRDGVINLTFGNNAHSLIKGKMLSIRPAVVEDAPVVPVTWVCGTALGPDKMTIRGDNKTTVANLYLPMGCKAPGQ
ncbi:MAG: pilin [Sulfuricella sp.]|nr:pilin [Sulfuricella sp.]